LRNYKKSSCFCFSDLVRGFVLLLSRAEVAKFYRTTVGVRC
jgi:hypothetical protein